MPNVAVSTNFGSLSTYVFPGGYDSTKLGLGPLMVQANDSGNEGKWVGPTPVAVTRPVQTALAAPGWLPDAVYYNATYDWVIVSEVAASTTPRIQLFTFNKTVTTNPWSYVGSITCTPPSAGTLTMRGNRISYEKYTTGTVAVTNNSTSVTGTSTTWTTDRIFVGCRIGFGSTDPSQISTWYEISAVGSNTSITLTQVYAGSTLSGQAYVIEDLRVLMATTASSSTLSGTFMVAGIRYENFTNPSTTIPAATTVDKIRAVYWLGDGNAASNSTCQTLGGIAIDAKTSWTSQMFYALDVASANARIQVNNFRAAMTLSSGRDNTSSTWQLNTGVQTTTGTVAQNQNLVLCTPSHGPRSGTKSLFWVTSSRIQSATVAGCTTASTTFITGVATEVPPGGTNTFAVTSSMSSIAYDSLTDRFMVFCGTYPRCYWTQYREDGGQWDRVFLADYKQTNQSSADGTAAIFPNTLSLQSAASFVNGMCYFGTSGTTATTNFLYNTPLGCDWEYGSTTNCRVVMPAMSTANWSTFVAGYMNVIEVIGGKTGYNLGQEPSAVRMYYRTSGISNNSGSWTLLDYAGDMTNITAATQVQAMIEFRTITVNGLAGRIARVGFEGTGTVSDSHFQFSQNNSSLASKQFAYRYSTAFGTTVPTLYIRIYDGVTGSLLVSDNSASPTGTWEKSTNGGSSWASYNTTDRANETTYLRYTPASIADNVNAMPVLTLS